MTASRPRRCTAILALLGLLGGLAAARAEEHGANNVAAWDVAPASHIRLDGAATITEWSCTGADITGTIHLPLPDPDTPLSDQIATASARVPIAASEDTRIHLLLPIDGLDCGNRHMEEDLREAMRSDEYPVIDFRLLHIRRLEPHEDGSVLFVCDGALSLAGVTRTVPIQGRLLREKGDYVLRLRTEIRMNDFGIRPPTALFGLIRAHDLVRVGLQLVASPPDAELQARADDEAYSPETP